MGHGYIGRHYGNNCTSTAFVALNNFHKPTTIFNINNGTQFYGDCCGGGHGGFWGGLGAGLGWGVANLLGNLPWFNSGFSLGGFGMSNLFGGFGGGFGGGMNLPWMGGSVAGTNPWGGSRVGSSSRVSDKETVKDGVKDDIDNPKIAELSGKVKELAEKAKNGTVTPEEVKKLKDELDAAYKAADDIAKAHDQKTYNNLKGILDTIKTTPSAGSESDKVNDSDPNSNNGGVKSLSDLPEDKQAELKATKIPEATLNELLKAGIPADTIKALSAAGLSPDDMKKLNELGVDYKSDIEAFTCPKELTADNIKALSQLSKKAKIPVAMGYNPNSSDKYIKGFIAEDSIKEDSNKLSYTIDCENVKGAKFGNEYSVNQKEPQSDKYTITVSKLRHGTNKGAKEFTWDPTEKRLENNGAPIVTE